MDALKILGPCLIPEAVASLKIARLKIKTVEMEDLKALLYTLKIVASIKNVIYYEGCYFKILYQGS